MENNIIKWATRFATAGFYVFPLYHSSKGPMKPFGWARNKDPKTVEGKSVEPAKIIAATIDLEEIANWPDRVKEGYNSHIVAYGVMGINCVIFDLDVKKGKNGVMEFRILTEKYGVPHPQLLVKTKSGGLHLYYTKSKKFSKLEFKTLSGLTIDGTKYSGVDVRGTGGMVIGPLSEGPSSEWSEGEYKLIRGEPGVELSELPDDLSKCVLKTMITSPHNDLEAIISTAEEKSDDVIAKLRRGEIPTSLPDGQRNEGFYAFINALKSKNIPKESAKVLCKQLALVCDDPETLHHSVNIDEMLNRIYTTVLENPYDIARDLMNRGFMQLAEQRNTLSYVMLNPNPYMVSTAVHDASSMKTLLTRFSKNVEQPSGKPKLVNPMDVIIHTMLDDNRADILGFKPGAGDVFQITSDDMSKKIVNLYQPPPMPIITTKLHDTIFDEFMFVISRVFGDKGSEEYQLGMDFCAWFLQRPFLKPAVCPYVMSRNRGVGKSLLIDALSQIAGVNKQGDKQCRKVKIDEIGGRFFNPAGFTLLMFDEVQFPVHRDMRKESTTFWRHMKDLVTATESTIEIKGGSVFQVPNLSGMLMAGNSGAHFPIEEYDRRIWVIDNNPPQLEKGLVDNMFDMTRETIDRAKIKQMVETLRYRLSKHEIKLALDVIRAPMTEAKAEMYQNSLSDIEEWWITHFEDKENLLARTPILSKSAIIYLISTSERLMNTKYREDPDATFREIKRRGLIRPVRTKGDQKQSRNIIGISTVSPNGDLVENDKREVVYTSRNHGEYDDVSNPALAQMYHDNAGRIKNWKTNKVKAASSAQDLIH